MTDFINPSIVKVIDKAFYYVTQAFGGAPNLISYMANLDGGVDRLQERVVKILSHQGGIDVISPWQYSVELFQGDALQGFSVEDTMIPDLPYSVFDWEGRLLYRVSNNSGSFGYSPLDKILVLQSRIGDMYFLQYRTYSGVKTKLLLANNPTLNTMKVLSNKALQAPDEDLRYEIPSDNTITFSVTSLVKPLTIRVYRLPSAPVSVPTPDTIKSSPSGQVETFPVESWDDRIIWYPKVSGWVYLEGDRPLTISRPYGDGADRFTQATAYVWYCAVGKELNSLLVRPGVGRTPPEFSRDGLIKLEANLS